ncbi:response regulator transcription factor [Phaeobacter gallaeciensis]|uniref:helix-turn-helix transcriptional regulator n=1 Tax=Phaeobacter gallaeciensis TaxID=60890 RepID=UPI00237F9B41|nr:response regulator transcription factor [Phaeobacter gallaeciensis]MDE4305376.1 response regulator transcription factor [Phaeobacter gallaeciensis]MDE4309724.1 response regulator transcription factor [Phaeobacter gallaeciensis]MDE4313953.1 response regulator transcription factor [Phaeobacter gallaeciensis]MDE4318653.1 response regulator transcription factor [Phaeobacter gallaeciensis]MDE4322587.1 response regulator transcription factor [Phaeobacter gallaeciensis]
MSVKSITILGGGATLSEQCARVIKQEYAGVQLIRLKSIDQLKILEHSEGMTVPGPTSLALVEQEVIEEDIEKGLEAVKLLAPRRVVLAYHDDDVAAEFYRHVRGRQELGRFGFLPMNLQLDCWLSMLRLLILDQGCVPNALLAKVRPQASSRVSEQVTGGCRCADANLTPRENEILRLVARGKQNKLIAADLAVSEHTVKLHMHNIMKKLGVRNRTEAAGLYFSEARTG